MLQITKKTGQRRQYAILLFNFLFLIFFIWIAYRAFYTLFVLEPGVNFPRVTLSENNWGKTVVHFTLNVPTTTSFIIFGSALLGIFASVWVFIATLSGKVKLARTYWRILAFAFVASLIAYSVQVFDFFTTAFEGVG